MANAQAEEGLSDLDDIDALLEEAEQALEEAEPEVLTDVEAVPEEVEASEPTEASPAEEAADAAEEAAPAEPEAAAAEVAQEAESASEPEPEPPAQSAEEEAPVEAEVPAVQASSKPAQVVEEDEPPIPERHKLQGKPNKSDNELTAADMDKLKKLILAFGITTIVLLVIGLGLTIWAAIAASTTHLDEETQTLLEELKTGIEHVAVKSERQDKTLEAIEKKIDALSFQLEQINGDIGKLEEIMKSQPAPVAASVAHGQEGGQGAAAGHGGNTHGGGHAVQSHQPAEPAHGPASTHGYTPPAGPVVATIDPDLKKTLGNINGRLIHNQKKVEQVYKALRKLQAQYRVMLSTLKKISKEIKAQQQQAETKKKTVKHEYYKYDARPYDPESIGAYP